MDLFCMWCDELSLILVSKSLYCTDMNCAHLLPYHKSPSALHFNLYALTPRIVPTLCHKLHSVFGLIAQLIN